VDCIDISSDLAVIQAANSGIDAAMAIIATTVTTDAEEQQQQQQPVQRPLLMVSINDHEDPHFQKAAFDSAHCPADCPRPCERVCPALAIPPLAPARKEASAAITTTTAAAVTAITDTMGVIADRCYGCTRCVGACPLGLITTEPYKVVA
jgi:Fe-S-cluster-containing hydrogenase component 2